VRDADLLKDFVLEARAERLEAVLAARLAGVTVVLEHVHDEGNISAVLRTAEAMGLLHVHVIEGPDSPFVTVPDITQGCERWLEIHRSPEGAAYLDRLRGQGYRLYGSTPGEGAVDLGDLDFSAPAALVFGNEHQGLSAEALLRCDRRFRIRMQGMTRSFNISVAAALALQHATGARRRALGRPGDLSVEEHAALRDRWYREEVREPEKLLKRLREGR
jgi:tRNA (guanosine-2'-O-)-methyltransferase